MSILQQNIKVAYERGQLVTAKGCETTVEEGLVKGIEANNPRSCSNLDITFKQEDSPFTREKLKRLNDRTRNSHNPLSLKEAQAKVETKTLVQAVLVNWNNLKDQYLAT